jgi:SAM-dependent methyltransferase
MLMNRGNAALNAYSLAQLGLLQTERVLEVGFGGGAALPRLLSKAAYVCGVDASPDVVNAANARFANAIRSGRADFLSGTIEHLPLPDDSFDKVLSVHTVYFWKSLDGGAREISRVLKNGGRVILGFVPKTTMDRMGMPPDIFTPREPDEIAAALQEAGFSAIELRKPRGDLGWMAATAVWS